jgi:hypothetical protein
MIGYILAATTGDVTKAGKAIGLASASASARPAPASASGSSSAR